MRPVVEDELRHCVGVEPPQVSVVRAPAQVDQAHVLVGGAGGGELAGGGHGAHGAARVRVVGEAGLERVSAGGDRESEDELLVGADDDLVAGQGERRRGHPHLFKNQVVCPQNSTCVAFVLFLFGFFVQKLRIARFSQNIFLLNYVDVLLTVSDIIEILYRYSTTVFSVIVPKIQVLRNVRSIVLYTMFLSIKLRNPNMWPP